MSEEFYRRERFEEELQTASQMGGPGDADPPYARKAYPVVALPRVLHEFVMGAANAMGVPPECVALPAIAVCASAIGNTCRVKLTPTWSEPSVIWAVTLMESGSLKTPAYKAAMEPLLAAQQLQEEAFGSIQQEWANAKVQYAQDMEVWRAKSVAEPNLPAPVEPAEPKPVDYFTSDSTVEALGVLFASNPRGLAVTRDELSGFFGSFGAYKGGRGSDESAYLEFYNAGSVKLNRASGKRIYVRAAALSIFGTCQPAVFVSAVGASGSRSNQVDNGLAARFLIASPASKAKTSREPRSYKSREYHELVAKLLAIPLMKDKEGRVEPTMVVLTPEAVERFKQFVNEHGKQTAAIGNAALRYHYAKLEAMAARLALIFFLCDSVMGDCTGGVQDRHVLAGIALARWHGREALRVYDGYEGPADREQKELLEEIRSHGGVISVREMQHVRTRWKDLAAAEQALRTLARNGYGVLAIESSGPQGGRPSLKFRLFDKPRDSWNVPAEPRDEPAQDGEYAFDASGETEQDHITETS